MFKSFWMAGFEGSTGFNRHGRWFDHVEATGHDRRALDDYRAIRSLGLTTARDTVRWPLVDQGFGRYDFSSLAPMLDAARDMEVEVIWDLFHYGHPAFVDLYSKDFPEAFASYAVAAATYIARRTKGPLWFTPINEPSFLAFAAGEEALFSPWSRGRGNEMKISLMRAAIASINAIRREIPSARFVNVDPICYVSPPAGMPMTPEMTTFNGSLVFEAWDMLAGRLHPELGGSPAHLDCVGINYYWTNQWEWGAPPAENGVIPPLDEGDKRRRPLRDLIADVSKRYEADIIISETSHMGAKRAEWIYHVDEEARAALRAGLPLKGICLYPILGMPEWHEPDTWIPMGLWEPVSKADPSLGRRIHEPMRLAIKAVRRAPYVQAGTSSMLSQYSGSETSS